MIHIDDRTQEQKDTHRYLIIGTDRFLSGWGQASNGASVAAWACECFTDSEQCLKEVGARGDMSRVRVVYEGARKYRPRNAAHLHVYVWSSGKEFKG